MTRKEKVQTETKAKRMTARERTSGGTKDIQGATRAAVGLLLGEERRKEGGNGVGEKGSVKERKERKKVGGLNE